MSLALGMMVGTGIYTLTSSSDVQLRPSKRHAIMRSWGEDHQQSLFHKLAKPVQPEGMGIDHNAWKKGKDEYYKRKD